MGAAWRHSYSRSLTTLVAPPSRISQSFPSKEAACLQGWEQIKQNVSKRQSWVASFSGGVCEISGDGRSEKLPVFGGVGAGRPIGMQVTRDDGTAMRFNDLGNGLSHTYEASPGNSQQISRLSNVYRLVDKQDNVETYDLSGKLLSIVSRSGNSQTLVYSGPDGKLSAVNDNFGHSLVFGYNPQGGLSSVTDALGGITRYVYDASGRLSSATASDGSTRQYLYSDSNWPNGISSLVDENNGTVFNLTYDTQGRVLSSILGGVMSAMTFVYNSDGSTVQTDVLGSVRTFTFRKVGSHLRSAAVTGLPCPKCGYSKAITYDSNGFVSSITDYNDHITKYLHDVRGLETSRTEAFGTPEARTVTTIWHASYRLPMQISEPGRTTGFTYDSNGNQLTKTVTDTATSTARTWTFTYDSLGKVLTADGPRTDVQDTTAYTYYNCNTGGACGQLHTVTNALGHVTTFNTYDANGRPLTITDPNGLASTLTYSPRGWIKTVTVGGETTSYDYWPTGLLKRIDKPSGQRLDYAYDAAHRLTDITDELGHRIRYTLNAMGKPTTIEVFDQASTRVALHTRQYNVLNRLWKDIGASNQTTVYDYDANGNLTTVTDPLNRVTTNAHDALDRLKQVTNTANGLTRYGFNALDQLISVTDPRNLQTQYTVDALDNTTQLQSPDTGGTVNTHDEAGNLKSRRDAKNQTTYFQYDALNRLTQLTRADGGSIIYSYDQGSNGLGRLTGMTDEAGGTAWAYDVQGRVLAKSVVFIGNSTAFTTRWAYDAAGRVQSQTFPSGKVIGYQWVNGRINALTLNGGALIRNIQYQPFAGMKTWTFANGQTAGLTFDLDGRPTSDPVHASLGYDDASRITSRVLGNRAYLSGSQSYGYDTLDRLSSYTGAGGPLGYLYDANGNRTRQNGVAGTITSAIDPPSNRQTSITQITPLGYDANGSLVNYGASTYSYDTLGRMSGLVRGSNTLGFVYNGLGQRAKKTVGSYSKVFVYDDQGLRLGEYNHSGSSMIEELVYLDERPMVTLRPTGTFYIHTDYLKTPRQIDNSQGLAVWAWNPATFGTDAANQNPRGVGNSFIYNGRYPGQYHDIEGLINYNYFRTYIPGQGRYAESDPIGLSGGINTYAYVEGNPISNIDPMGLQSFMGAGGYGGSSYSANVNTQSRIQLRPERNTLSFGIGGCIVTGCVNYDSSNSAPTVSAPFPPDLGGGVSMCMNPEKPPSDCDDDGSNQRNLNIGLGRFLGASFGNDGSVCLNLGAAIASPVEINIGSGTPLWK